MKLTKREALRKSIEMWDWLAKTGNSKLDWFKFKRITDIPSSGCYLCEWAEQNNPAHCCDRCPLYPCIDDSEPYKMWHYARTLKDKNAMPSKSLLNAVRLY